MQRILTAAVAAVLLAGGTAGAQDDGSVVLDRMALSDGSAEVSVGRELHGRLADFGLSLSRERQEGEDTVVSGGEGSYPVRVADRKRHARLRLLRAMCDEPVAIAGTVTKRVARVELVAADGTVTRLRRHPRPAGWGRRVLVIGAMRPSAASIREVRAVLRGGKVVARVRPEPVTPCPEP